MAQSPAAPAPPQVKPGIGLDDLPVAQTELEPPYRVLIHNNDSTCPRKQKRPVFSLVAT